MIHCGRRAGGKVPGDGKRFLCFVQAAKAVPGVDDQLMRSVHDATLKQADLRPAILEHELVIDIDLHSSDAS
jgi:hypothetical protein